MKRPAVVCVPACNEAHRLPTLLQALSVQSVSSPVNVALCINNSSDNSVAEAEAAAARSGGRLRVIISTQDFPLDLAHAGSARRAAMDLGAEWLHDDDALLVSTDADCRPPPNWLAENLAHAGQMRIVGGRIELDDAEAEKWPLLFARRRNFDDYWRKVREIEDLVDPVPWDLPPRHGDHTGASLALTIGLYRAAGGVPIIPSGEDRALVAAAVAIGGQLVHPQTVWTRTSPRPTGRARGGMADEMKRWLAMEKDAEWPHVPNYRFWHGRALWRRTMRPILGPARLMQAENELPPMPCAMPLPTRSPT